jgi:hypothetical protein
MRVSNTKAVYLKSEARTINSEGKIMVKNNVLVAITASREKDEIVYRVESSSNLANEEFEYYLSEIINGICKWKKNICEENIRNFKGTLKEKKK